MQSTNTLPHVLVDRAHLTTLVSTTQPNLCNQFGKLEQEMMLFRRCIKRS